MKPTLALCKIFYQFQPCIRLFMLKNHDGGVPMVRRYRQRRKRYYTYHGYDDEETYPILPPPPDEEKKHEEEDSEDVGVDEGEEDEYGSYDSDGASGSESNTKPDDDDDDPWKGFDEAVRKAKETVRSLEDSFLDMVERKFGRDVRNFMEKFVHVPSSVLEAVEIYFPEIRRVVSEIIKTVGIALAEMFLLFVIDVARAWKAINRIGSHSLYDNFIYYCRRLIMCLTKLVVKTGVAAARMFEELSEKIGLKGEDEDKDEDKDDNSYDEGEEYGGDDYQDFYNYW